ncbi:CsbD family protein [Adhaeribacter rhizoryzae]|uniref:CsbD family protein n=1 Tax=Adhaeribacter rhizoryzae TaxID=2607907 RepID=UPI001CC217FC|nr:CsbD family protein [Adhaeribacter rhizoryzae]
MEYYYYNRQDDLFEGQELRTHGNWNELKTKARQQYSHLTNDDLEYSSGRQEEWFNRLSTKLGRSVDDVKDWFRHL